MAGYKMICCIVNMGDSSKALQIAKKYKITGGTISIGQGTVNSRLLDFLGLHDIRKEIVTMMVEDELEKEAIAGISREMAFEKPHHGIAFSHSVFELIGKENQIEEKPKTNEVKEIMYNAIYVVVDKGNAEAVIDAANEGGARGGTIVNARSFGIHESQKLFSLEIEPEKEEVLIIAKSEMKDKIVASIRENIKLDEPGNGIMFVIDVNEAYGLH